MQMRGIASSMVLFILGNIASAQTAPSNVTVTLTRLIEKRELAPGKDDFDTWKNGIDITLHVDGPDVQEAHKYGKLRIKRAVDDVGTDLSQMASGFGPDSDHFQEIDARADHGLNTERTGFNPELTLAKPSARSAKTIRYLGGELLVLVGGEKKIVRVKPSKTSWGKAVDEPALKSAGVTIRLIEPSKQSVAQKLGGLILEAASERCVMVEMAGNIDAVANLMVADGSGAKINGTKTSGSEAGARVVLFEMLRSLPDDAALQIEVWPGQKNLTVPFEFKDVTLP
jgi:hypothetical protein